MRFSTAWAKTAAQNVTLKTASALLGIVCLFQLSMIAGLSMKDPLVVERSCFSKAMPLKNSKPTQDEIASFLGEAIPMRFDSSGNLKDGFLALDETISREKMGRAFSLLSVTWGLGSNGTENSVKDYSSPSRSLNGRSSPRFIASGTAKE